MRCCIAAAAAALALAGCAVAEPPGPTAPCDAPARFNAAAAAERGLAPPLPQPLSSVGARGARALDGVGGLVVVEEVLAGRRPNGTVEVSARLLNCTVGPLQVEAATRFFDARNAAAEPRTAWQRLFLPPGTSRDYTELSTSQRPASFVVEFRAGR